MPVLVDTRPVRENGLVGVLCKPAGIAPAPGVLLVGGSEGGFHERDAQVLAGEGFTVLALAYFGAPGLRPGLVDIPLEYFARGLDLLAAEPRAGRRFGMTGASRGGEAALLMAAHDSRVAATVSVVGSGIVTEGIDFRHGNLLGILTARTNSWTRGGVPVPYLPYAVTDEFRAIVAGGRPVPLAAAFAPVPDDPVELDRVSIPIEQTQGEVLLISAECDASWPSTAYTEVAAERLRAACRSVEHLVLPGAGHLVAGPPGRAQLASTSPGPGLVFEMGGTPATTTEARDLAWARTVEFFADHLTG